MTSLVVFYDMKEQYIDEDGYPTRETLLKIEEWSGSPQELMKFVEDIWWMNSALWKVADTPHRWREGSTVKTYTVSTGGWSGNEDIIRAMERSSLWSWIWYQSRRGGHYIFEIDPATEW